MDFESQSVEEREDVELRERVSGRAERRHFKPFPLVCPVRFTIALTERAAVTMLAKT